MSDNWPFDQPRDCATVTSAEVMQSGELITHVYHDEADHGWQFHPANGTTTADMMLVALEELVKIDPSILEVATLPPGWMAIRSACDGAWTRKETYGDAPEIVIDWTTISSPEGFFDSVLPQCKSPSWHGGNLNALRDSWITGSINPEGPPYRFKIFGEELVAPALVGLRDAVREIASESVDENGGSIRGA